MTLDKEIRFIKKKEWSVLKNFLKRSDSIGKKNCKGLIYFPYWFVKVELPDLINTGNFEEILNKCLNLPKEKVKKLKANEALPFVFWVTDEIKKIQELEKNYLSGAPDVELINAGINKLDELGETNIIDALAGGDILKWEEVKKLPYHQVFDKQRKNKLESEIQKDLAKIQKEKSKIKK